MDISNEIANIVQGVEAQDQIQDIIKNLGFRIILSNL